MEMDFIFVVKMNKAMIFEKLDPVVSEGCNVLLLFVLICAIMKYFVLGTATQTIVIC